MAVDFGLLGNPVNPLQVLQSLAMGQQQVQQRAQMEQEAQQRQQQQQMQQRQFALQEQKFGFDQQQAMGKQNDERHELGVKLLNSVTDEASYVRARQIAISRGIQEAAQLPETYDATAQQAVAVMKQEYAALNPAKQEADPSVIRSLREVGIDPMSPEGRQIVINNLNPPQYQAFGDNLYQTRGAGLVGGQARGDRNGNPGNIKDGPWARSQPGYVGSDGTFAKFEPGAGERAQERLLTDNYLAKGFNTPAEIVGRYAPSSENSQASMSNYAGYVAGKLGIGPNDPVRPEQVSALASAMREFENGRTGGGGPRVVATKPKATDMPKQNAKGIYQGVSAKEQYEALPRGAKYMDPTGNIRTKS